MLHPSGVGGAAQFLSKLFLGHKSCRTPQVWVVRPNSCLNYFLGINHAAVGGAAQFLSKLFLGHKSCCTPQVWVVRPNSCLNYFLGINHAAPLRSGWCGPILV